jgi:hypothetical protein
MDSNSTLMPDLFDCSMPDLTGPPSQRDDNFYKKAIRHFSKFYNPRLQSFESDETPYYMTDLEQIKENFSYMYARQSNKDYAYMATDGVTRKQDSLGIVPGGKVSQIVEWMRGKFQEMINNMELEAISISQDAKTRETNMFDKVMLSYLLKPELSQLAQEGVDFMPAGPDFKPEISEDVYRWMDRSFSAKMQITSKYIADDILYNNHYKQLFLRAATHVLVAGRAGIEAIAEKGKMKLNQIPAWQLITDTSVDDDFNRKARFAGYVTYMTPVEIFSRWDDFSVADKETIKKLANGDTLSDQGEITYTSFNSSHSNFNWWNRHKGGDMEIAVVKMYFKCTEDANYKKRYDRYGNPHIKKQDYQTKTSSYTYQGWRQGVLIGNMFLRDAGEVPNRVGSVGCFDESDCPLKIFMPNMNLGENRSVTDKLKKHQDRIDAFRRKLTDNAAKLGGKGIVINGSVFGIRENDKVVADLKRDGVSVINAESGEPGEASPFQGAIMPIDMSGDPNMRYYIDLIREEERNMEEISNIPKIAQGTQSGYIGAGVQDRTLAQSALGTATLYYGFIEWVNYLMQYSVNVAKYAMTASNDDYHARLKIGDIGYKYVHITRELRLEEVSVWFKVQDVIDESAKGRIRAYAQAFSQNPEWGIDPLDILELERARTWTEMINNLEYSLKRKKREMAQQKVYNDMLAQIQNERAQSAQAEQAQLQSETSRANTQDKIQGDITKEAIKQNPELVN